MKRWKRQRADEKKIIIIIISISLSHTIRDNKSFLITHKHFESIPSLSLSLNIHLIARIINSEINNKNEFKAKHYSWRVPRSVNFHIDTKCCFSSFDAAFEVFKM
jgi:hypothetical protein